jgi:hypothetical protein
MINPAAGSLCEFVLGAISAFLPNSGHCASRYSSGNAGKEKGSLRCLLIFAPNEVPSSSGFGAVLAAEFLDAACGVHDLLGAGVERMALGADFDVQFRFAHGGAGCELVAAAACHCDFFVFRVNGGFHFVFLAKVGRGLCTRTDTD